jgi:hypothetical protein
MDKIITQFLRPERFSFSGVLIFFRVCFAVPVKKPDSVVKGEEKQEDYSFGRAKKTDQARSITNSNARKIAVKKPEINKKTACYTQESVKTHLACVPGKKDKTSH